MRRIKKGQDLINHRRACQISAEAHNEVMKYVRPGMSEREIHGFFIYQILKRGAAREGYNTIVAGGANSCILHYVFNDQILNQSELLLLDGGAEYNYFTGDITRTYPVGGRFSKEQKDVYNRVLQIQKNMIAAVRPGVSLLKLHEIAAEELTEAMLELGLLSGRKQDLIKSNEHKKYYPHGLGHYLGMDVHDSGLYVDRKNEQKNLEPGMVVTIEPGLYIPAHDDQAPSGYRGIGIRIEDDILVTATGAENMTETAWKEVDDLEKNIGRGN